MLFFILFNLVSTSWKKIKNSCILKGISIKWNYNLNKKRKKKINEPAKPWSSKRELIFKPQTKENLVLFVVLKLYIKYKKGKMNYVEKCIIHLKFFFT